MAKLLLFHCVSETFRATERSVSKALISASGPAESWRFHVWYLTSCNWPSRGSAGRSASVPKRPGQFTSALHTGVAMPELQSRWQERTRSTRQVRVLPRCWNVRSEIMNSIVATAVSVPPVLL
ncbi:MAG: hypothetical protein RLZZ436_3113 [Planctomycetota bacterium]